jgi:hypothetical protein
MHVAFRLSCDPGFKRTPIAEAATRFNLPDLEEALREYIIQCHSRIKVFTLHARCTAAQNTAHLPIPLLEIWQSFRLQSKAYYYPHDILPGQTINAAPPSDEWPHGKCDTIAFNIDDEKEWPNSGIDGNVLIKSCQLKS